MLHQHFKSFKRIQQGIIFYSFFPLLCFLSLLPCWFLYRVADVCYYLIYYIIRYRRKIVRHNLQYAFPKKTFLELLTIEKSFYIYLCDLLVEHIKSLTISQAQINRRCIIQNIELLQKMYTAGKHILLVTGHYGNWEWAAAAVALQTSYQLAVVYKPLSNSYFDTLLVYVRKRFGKHIIPQKKVLRSILNYGSIPMATAILDDQAPSAKHAAYVIDFFSQSTYTSIGIERIAKKCNQSVVYIHIQRIKRGYYTMEAELITDNPLITSVHEITKDYIRLLEVDIRQNPAFWLWSHNKWKHKILPKSEI